MFTLGMAAGAIGTKRTQDTREMTMYRQYTLLNEPRGTEYVELLRTLSRYCQYALLVVRRDLPLSSYGHETLRELEQDIMMKEERQEWPGTRLLNDSATVYLMRLTANSLGVLCNRASRLYEWEQPFLPEDLCLMRSVSEPMLVSISHEKDAYLLLSEDEKRTLLSALPNLRIIEEHG